MRQGGLGEVSSLKCSLNWSNFTHGLFEFLFGMPIGFICLLLSCQHGIQK